MDTAKTLAAEARQADANINNRLRAADRKPTLYARLADEIDALSARLTPPAEVVRYEPMVQPFRGEDVVTMAVVNFGQWVRYEDHAAAVLALRLELYGANCKVDEATEALAASEAKRKEVEDAMRRVTESLESAKASTTNDQYHGHVRQARSIARADLDQPKTEDAA